MNINESRATRTSLTSPACSVFYELMPDPATSWYAIVPFAIIYLTIFVLGVAGNIAVIYVTTKHHTLQTVQNIFIMNLAASDIMVCLLSLPITPVTNIFKNWFFGTILCRLIPWVQGVSMFICTFSLGAIAVDRYILVVHPHFPPLQKKGALIVTGILWSLSFIVTLPYALFMYLEDYEGICGCFCTEKWPNSFSRRAYTMVVMCAQFVVPFIVMAFCYATIFARLRTRALVRLKKIDAHSHALGNSTTSVSTTVITKNTHTPSGDQRASLLDSQERGRAKLLAQTRRTTSILSAMVVIFGLTWLPHNVVSLIIEFDDNRTFFHLWGRGDLDLSYLINLFTHSIAMTNNISNPVLYAWLNPSFRELVIQTCFGRRHKQKCPSTQRLRECKSGGNRESFVLRKFSPSHQDREETSVLNNGKCERGDESEKLSNTSAAYAQNSHNSERNQEWFQRTDKKNGTLSECMYNCGKRLLRPLIYSLSFMS